MKIVQVGAGGFAEGYVRELLDRKDPAVEWVGVVDPYIENCRCRDEILEAGIPVYNTLEEFYQKDTADLAAIATPTFLHREQSITALQNGSCVLCEKPAAPTAADAEAMLRAEEETGRFLAIGYQWSYADATLALKRDILAGKYGRPLSVKTTISWPRERSYYARGGGWGGRIFKDGRLVLDSILSNACAHYLHNMLFLLGGSMEESTEAVKIEAECLRANAIENFDTCTLRAETPAGTRLYFAATHAADTTRDPVYEAVFEKGTVTFEKQRDSLIHGRFADGTETVYGNPFAGGMNKLWICADAVRQGKRPVCTVRTATPHVRIVEQLYREVPILNFPAALIRENTEKNQVYVEGLFDALQQAYEKEAMLSEVFPAAFGMV